MAAGASSVISTRTRSALSQRSTLRAARATTRSESDGATRRRSGLGSGRRLPIRRDATTGFRIVDAVVIHAAQDAHELLLHLLDLLQRHRRIVELTGIHFGP